MLGYHGALIGNSIWKSGRAPENGQACCFQQEVQTLFYPNEAFTDSIGEKVAVNAGGGITKAIISTVNVEKPQSQANTTIFAEFSGVKDTPHNFTTAVFDKDGWIWSDIESIMNRRCILLKIVMAGKMQVVGVNNTAEDHNVKSLQPLPTQISGYQEYNLTQPAPECNRFAETVANEHVDEVINKNVMKHHHKRDK